MLATVRLCGARLRTSSTTRSLVMQHLYISWPVIKLSSSCPVLSPHMHLARDHCRVRRCWHSTWNIQSNHESAYGEMLTVLRRTARDCSLIPTVDSLRGLLTLCASRGFDIVLIKCLLANILVQAVETKGPLTTYEGDIHSLFTDLKSLRGRNMSWGRLLWSQ